MEWVTLVSFIFKRRKKGLTKSPSMFYFSEFPAITICLDEFEWLDKSESGPLKNNCSDGKEKVAISNFYEALMFCLNDKMPLEKSTTTEENYFGGMFDLYDEEDFIKYASIEELLEGIKINIDDILYEFYFGGYIHISPYQMTIDGRNLLRADWKAELHYRYGYCYTFDPKVSVKPNVLAVQELVSGTTLLSMKLKFNVISI